MFNFFTLQLFLLNTPEHSGCQIILNNAIYSKLSEGKMMISFIRMDFVVLNLNMIKKKKLKQLIDYSLIVAHYVLISSCLVTCLCYVTD